MSDKLSRPLLLVGCGKMGGAMLEGWLADGIAGGGVWIVDPAGASGFADKSGVTVVGDADELPAGFDPEVIIMAVKPQAMDAVAGAYAQFAGPRCVYVSIAAGTTITYFENAFGSDAAVIRAMPNTPAAIGQGITVLCPNGNTSDAQAAIARALLQAVGEAHIINDETLMDAVTAVSGSGPAYVFWMIDCMAKAGVAAGLPETLAAQLALQTVAGAGQLARTSDDTPDQLRRNVTSPGGTTQAALEVLMAEDGLQPLMNRAVKAAARRGKELAG